MGDLCDICGYEITDEMSAHNACEEKWNRRSAEKLCVRCGLDVEGNATTHHECLGAPYIGYGPPG